MHNNCSWTGHHSKGTQPTSEECLANLPGAVLQPPYQHPHQYPSPRDRSCITHCLQKPCQTGSHVDPSPSARGACASPTACSDIAVRSLPFRQLRRPLIVSQGRLRQMTICRNLAPQLCHTGTCADPSPLAKGACATWQWRSASPWPRQLYGRWRQGVGHRGWTGVRWRCCWGCRREACDLWVRH